MGRCMWTSCFGGKKGRPRRIQAVGSRVRETYRDRSSAQTPTSKHDSLGAQLKSPLKEVLVHEEVLQPKPVAAITPNNSKLFKRKSVRRAKSCGSSTAFENGAKRLFDRGLETKKVGHIDRLQEEVEDLRKRLAKEEEEARRLRHEVSYLRSCGLIQSPDRQRSSCNSEKANSSSSRGNSDNRDWQSWLGLSLSPASRFQLEEQLRCMAADEMSKVPGKGLTNGQKALIIATKLWRNQGHPQEESQSRSKLPSATRMSNGDNVDGIFSGETHTLRTEEIAGRHFDSVVVPSTDRLLTSTNEDRSFREQLQGGEDSSLRDVIESPPSTTSDMENFTFHPVPNSDDGRFRQFSPDIPSPKGTPQLQRVPSCPEQMITGLPLGLKDSVNEIVPGPGIEQVKLESPRRSCSLPSISSESQTSDPDHVQARRFIDLRYQELEEKLLKSPKDGNDVSENLALCRRKNQLADTERESPEALKDRNRSEAEEGDTSFISNGIVGASSLAAKPFFGCKSGRLWQPLSPVREVDSGRSSGEDLDSAGTSQFQVSDSIDSSSTSDIKSSVRTIISGCEWEHQEELSQRHDDINEVHDDDLFTLSPRRLHRTYNPWEDHHRFDNRIEHKWKAASPEVSGSGLPYSDGADSEDFVPIQCQSPTFSPKQKFNRNKFIKGKSLKIEDYPRDKFFKEMGFKTDDFLTSTDSLDCEESIEFEKESQDRKKLFSTVDREGGSSSVGEGKSIGNEILPPSTIGQLISACPCDGIPPVLKRSLVADEPMPSPDCEHPILGSIENLPQRVKYHGMPSKQTDRESQCQDTLDLGTNEIVTSSPLMVKHETSTVLDTSEAKKQESQSTQEQGHGQEIGPGIGHQKLRIDTSPLEFSVTQGDHTGPSSDGHHQEEKFRLSLHGFVYDEEHLADQSCSSSLETLVDGSRHKSCSQCVIEEIPKLDKQGESVENLSVVNPERSRTTEQVQADETGKAPDAKVSDGEQSTVLLNDDVRHDVTAHGKSLGYRLRRLKQRDACRDPDLAVEFSSVGGESEVSRDGDETFHDCESPTLSENNLDLQRISGSQVDTNHDIHDFRTSIFHEIPEENQRGKKPSDISPDDRPILGTVATHWGDTESPKPHREWDGLGIPNSTSRFKEDQRVNWHSTPFETRLEQALAKLPIVPELHHQSRRLFEGVATS